MVELGKAHDAVSDVHAPSFDGQSQEPRSYKLRGIPPDGQHGQVGSIA
jgi:hypothetical protein